MCFVLHKKSKKRNEKLSKERFFKQNGGLLLQQKINEGTIRKTKHFLAKDLEKATDHFNESRILGKGGQGTVYKGMLSCGMIVAVKKSMQVNEDQLEQFINEVVILSQVDHINVVKLLGCCLETEVPLLVYEFIPNGTLFNLIHNPNTQIHFSWDMRLMIAADIAGALAYLHSSSSVHIYHRDIKSNNFLLDEKYVVKVADFGISRSIAEDRTHFTTNVKGTFGYFDPEYFQSHHYTEKSDVYSFGVVLVEILTGKMPIFYEGSEGIQKSLAWHFLESVEENKLDVILDPQVSKEERKEEVMVVARIAQNCLKLKGDARPTMKEVATELEGLRISRQPSTFGDESEEASIHEANSMVISNIQSTFSTVCIGETSTTFSDIHPWMFEAAEV